MPRSYGKNNRVPTWARLTVSTPPATRTLPLLLSSSPTLLQLSTGAGWPMRGEHCVT